MLWGFWIYLPVSNKNRKGSFMKGMEKLRSLRWKISAVDVTTIQSWLRRYLMSYCFEHILGPGCSMLEQNFQKKYNSKRVWLKMNGELWTDQLEAATNKKFYERVGQIKIVVLRNIIWQCIYAPELATNIFAVFLSWNINLLGPGPGCSMLEQNVTPTTAPVTQLLQEQCSHRKVLIYDLSLITMKFIACLLDEVERKKM